MPAIEIEGLVKAYRSRGRSPRLALGGLDLSVPEGGVFGLLGPNGSGKTTTIRCLIDLVRPSSGRCRVLGVDSQTELAHVIGRIGSLVEGPGLFPNFSGRLNLRLLGRLSGSGPRSVEATLERVGLADRGDDLVRTYSLGMLQRLGIAAALLKDPALLILDEPVNGLDPAGIKEVRDLLRELGDQGRTIFLSSHLLSEVEQVCDRVAIMSRGRCVVTGPVEEILAGRPGTGWLVRLEDPEGGVAILRAAGVESALEGELIRVNLPPGEAATIGRLLARRDRYPVELRPVEISLEALFLDLTKGEDPTP